MKRFGVGFRQSLQLRIAEKGVAVIAVVEGVEGVVAVAAVGEGVGVRGVVVFAEEFSESGESRWTAIFGDKRPLNEKIKKVKYEQWLNEKLET